MPSLRNLQVRCRAASSHDDNNGAAEMYSQLQQGTAEDKAYESGKVHPYARFARETDDPGTETSDHLNGSYVVGSALQPCKKSVNDINGLLSEQRERRPMKKMRESSKTLTVASGTKFFACQCSFARSCFLVLQRCRQAPSKSKEIFSQPPSRPLLSHFLHRNRAVSRSIGSN